MVSNRNNTFHSIGPAPNDTKTDSVNYDATQQKENNVLGKKLTEARKKMNLSQKELADKIVSYHISASVKSLSRWETGESLPNPYQLFALCYALQITDMLNYFTGATPEAYDFTPELNQKGLNLLQVFKDALIASGQYLPQDRHSKYTEPEPEIDMKVYLEPAAAGPGNPLSGNDYTMISYPVSVIPDRAEFGIQVAGQSMEPRYVDKQVVWVESCKELHNGEIGIFFYEGDAYIKKYILEQPVADEIDDYIDSTGRVVPKVTLYSLNRDCAHMDVHVKPGDRFSIYGRVLN